MSTDRARIRVFLSSTWLDLREEREAVEKIIHRMRTLEYSGMEHFGSRSESARDVSLAEVAECDLYVGLLAGRFGSGITEAEYRAARKADIPCLFYLKDESRIAEDQRDTSSEARARLKAFREELTDPDLVPLAQVFCEPNHLAAQVAADLHNWVFERVLAARLEQAARAGEVGLVRQITKFSYSEEPLRAALRARGVALTSSLFESLLTLAGPALLNQLFQGVEQLSSDYAARIQNFFDTYLGTTAHPVAFGGRDDDLRGLDMWLEALDPTPYLLLSGGAGSGKSALLARWTRHLLGREALHVVVAPVSIRFRTSLAAVFFPLLAARLAAIHGERLPARTDISVEAWRGIVSGYLARPVPDGHRLVLVVDGIDEAAGWSGGPDLFPVAPPEGLRIVLSARHTANAPDAGAWLRRLGWDAPHLARTLVLTALTSEGVLDVIRQAAGLLSDSERAGVAHEVYRLTAGDALLVQLYIADLQRGANVRDLNKVVPGLAGYFDNWWTDQAKQWGDATPLRQKDVQAILGILATAWGPLTRDDILALTPGDANLSSWTLDDALRPIERFVMASAAESGYVFSHPRFASFLRERMGKAEQRRWEQRYLEWGTWTLDQLAAGVMRPEDVSAYLVHYLGVHLEQNGAPPTVFLRLASTGWRRAWSKYDDGPAGFMNDLDRVWTVIDRENVAALQAAHAPAHVANAVRLAMLRAEIRSSTPGLTPALRERLVETGVWRLSRAITAARLVTDDAERAGSLARLARFADDVQRSSLEQEALAAALEEREPSKQGVVLGQMVATFQDPPVTELIGALSRLVWERRRVLQDAARWLLQKGDVSTLVHIARESNESLATALDAEALYAAVKADRQETVAALVQHADSDDRQRVLCGIAVHHAARKVPLPEWILAIAERDHTFPQITQLAALARGVPASLSPGDVPWLVKVLSGEALVTQEDVAVLVLDIRQDLPAATRRALEQSLPTAFGVPEPVTRLLTTERDAFEVTLDSVRSAGNPAERTKAVATIASIFTSGSEEQIAPLLGESEDLSEKNQTLFAIAVQLARLGRDAEAIDTVGRISFAEAVSPALVVLLREMAPDTRRRVGLPLLRSLDPGKPAHLDIVEHLMNTLVAEVEEPDLRRFVDTIVRPASMAEQRLASLSWDPAANAAEFERALASYVNDTTVSAVLLRAGVTGSLALRRGIAAMMLARPSYVTADVRLIGMVVRGLPQPEQRELFGRISALVERMASADDKLIMQIRLERLAPTCDHPILSVEDALALLQRLDDAEQRRDVLRWLHDRLEGGDRERLIDLVVEELHRQYSSLGRLDELLFETLPPRIVRNLEAQFSQMSAPHVWTGLASSLDTESRDHLLRWARMVTTLDADLIRVLVAFVPFLDGEPRKEVIDTIIGPRLIRHLGDALGHEFLFLDSNGKDFWQRFAVLIGRLHPEHWDVIVAEPNAEMRDIALYLLGESIRDADHSTQYRLLKSLVAPRTELSTGQLLEGLVALTPLIERFGGEAALASCRDILTDAPAVLA